MVIGLLLVIVLIMLKPRAFVKEMPGADAWMHIVRSGKTEMGDSHNLPWLITQAISGASFRLHQIPSSLDQQSHVKLPVNDKSITGCTG